jgi:hypothetical protein
VSERKLRAIGVEPDAVGDTIVQSLQRGTPGKDWRASSLKRRG